MAEENGLNSVNRSRNSSGNPVGNGRATLANHRRASIGSIRAGDGLLRNSAEKSDSADSSKKNVVPHYLRASTGSCHDLCKYGGEHSFEKKERKPFRKKIPKQPPFVEILLSDKQKKEKPSTDAKDHSPDLKPSRDSKYYSSKPKSSLDKGKAMKHKPSKGIKNHSPDMPSTDAKDNSPDPKPSRDSKSYSSKSKSSLDEGKAMKHRPSKDIKNYSSDMPSTDIKDISPDLKPSRDSKSYSPKPNSSSDKGKAMKHKPSEDTKNRSPDMPSAKSYVKAYSRKENGSSGNKTLLSKKPARRIPSADPPEIVKGVIFPSTEVEDSVKRTASSDKNLSKKTTDMSQSVKLKPVEVKASAYSDNSDGIHGKGTRNSSSKTGKNLTASRTPVKKVLGKNLTASKAPVKKLLVGPVAILSPKVSVNNIVRCKSGKAGNLKLVSSVKDQNKLHRVKTEESNDEKADQNKLQRVKTEESNDEKADQNKLQRANTEESIDEKADQNQLQRVNTEESIDEKADQNQLQRVKTEESNDEKVPEKTLHVIETETKNISESTPVSESISTESLSSADSDSSSFSSHEDDNVQTEQSSGEADEVKAPPAKENHNNTVRKSRAVVSEDKCHKLKFRSGKVVDVQLDSNSPRRLRFRRARVLAAPDSKGETRRALKKAGAKDDTVGAEVSSVKVVLKHQDVQDKKDAQGLFNNVIEETASKLVESRKSKVKALVGAFETVISLQETKPSSQVSSVGQ